MTYQDTHKHSPIRPSEAFLSLLEEEYHIDREFALTAFAQTHGQADINAYYEDNPAKIVARLSRIQDEANDREHPELTTTKLKEALGYTPEALVVQTLQVLVDQLVQAEPDQGIVEKCYEYLEERQDYTHIPRIVAKGIALDGISRVKESRADFYKEMLTFQTIIANEIAKNGDYDGMTQVFNKVAFERHFDLMIKKSKPHADIDQKRRAGDGDTEALSSKNQIAVFMIDLDGFKKTNDVIGHAAGDAVLIKVAEMLQDAVRDGDIVGRLGGDEFALAVRVENEEEARAVQQRIENLFKEKWLEWKVESEKTQAGKTIEGIRENGFNVLSIDKGMSVELPIRASVGMVMADLNCDASHALETADTLMFEQKKQHHAADPSLTRR